MKKIIVDFFTFSTVSVHHNEKITRFLLPGRKHELPDELLNDLRLKIIRNLKEINEVLEIDGTVLNRPPKS